MHPSQDQAAAICMEERRVVTQDLDPARPARDAVEGAHHRGRYGTEGDSCAAPRPDPRARLGVPPPPRALGENGFLHVRLKCDE